MEFSPVLTANFESWLRVPENPCESALGQLKIGHDTVNLRGISQPVRSAPWHSTYIR